MRGKLKERCLQMSELDCEKCGCKLHLMHDDMFIKLESGENIAFENMPFLVCGGCQKNMFLIYFRI